MTDKLQQQLSALVDNECDAAELELALHRLAKQPQLAACWQRYHLIGDVIGNQLPQRVDTNFAARVSAAVALEDAPGSIANATDADTDAHALRRWPLGGFAAAASVAAAVGLGLLMLNQTGFDPQPSRSAAVAPATVLPAAPPAAESRTTAAVEMSPAADTESRLNTYLVSHNALASANSIHGVLPYVQMAARRDGR